MTALWVLIKVKSLLNKLYFNDLIIIKLSFVYHLYVTLFFLFFLKCKQCFTLNVCLSYFHYRKRYVQEVPINMRNITIGELVPNTEYQLLINVVSSADLIGNSSHYVRFVSPDGGKKLNHKTCTHEHWW